MSRFRQVLIVELGVLTILVAATHHGAITAALVGAWIGFAVHSTLASRRSAKISHQGSDVVPAGRALRSTNRTTAGRSAHVTDVPTYRGHLG